MVTVQVLDTIFYGSRKIPQDDLRLEEGDEMPNVDIENKEHIDEARNNYINQLEESVDLIASGYEWNCPHCSHFNKEVEVGEHVACGSCSWIFVVGSVSHAVD